MDAPEPILIDHYVQSTLKELTAAGFTGDNILIAGHSLGGVMAQNYANKNTDTIKGQVLMGSVLLRDNHELNDDGTTHWKYDVPTLTLGGTKDGLMKVSRLAEAYWHQYINIEDAQKNLFPIYTLEGTTHMSYMTGEPPSAVFKKDLIPDVDDATARKSFGGAVVEFIGKVLAEDFSRDVKNDSKRILDPLV